MSEYWPEICIERKTLASLAGACYTLAIKPDRTE